jgi:hypothetical protein
MKDKKKDMSIKLKLRLDKDPSKYLVSAVTIGAVSNLENIICSVAGGSLDTRTYCHEKLDSLRYNLVYCPEVLQETILAFVDNYNDVVLCMEKLNNWCESPKATINFSASRTVLGICNYVLRSIASIKVLMFKNINEVHSDVLKVLNTNFNDLIAYIENVPVNIDTSLRVNMRKVLEINT